MFRPVVAWLCAALFCLTLIAVPSALSQTESGAEPAQEEQGTVVSRDDGELAEQVRKALGALPQYENVVVAVSGGVVSLKGKVLELENVARAEELISKIEGVVTVNNQIEVERSVGERVTPALERFEKRIDQFITLLPMIAIGLLVLVIFGIVGFLVARLKFPWDNISPNRFIADLVRQLVRLVFLLVGLVVALDIIGATALLGTILGAAGILGLAVGFAVRDTVENYIASVLLSFRQPFRPRDLVRIGEHEGYVISLTSRATVLMTLDGNHVRIPNATVFKGDLTNFTLNPDRRFEFRLGVETEDLQRAVSLGKDILNQLSFVLKEPAAEGWIEDVGDSSIILWFGAWIDQREANIHKARSEAIRKVKIAFEAEGIGLPEPIYRLRFDDGQALLKTLESADETPPKTPMKEAPPRIADMEEQDVSPDREIERKVAEETARNEDLLDENAPQEVSG